MTNGRHHWWGALRTGLSFGLASGVITTLGLMVGLHAGTHSRLVVIGGILTIAIADSMSDALGIHISEEAKGGHSEWEVWMSTLSTFSTKFLVTMSFIIPVLLLPLNTAILVASLWGLIIIASVSFFLARQQGSSPWRVILEHVFIGAIVVVLTHALGDWIANNLGTL